MTTSFTGRAGRRVAAAALLLVMAPGLVACGGDEAAPSEQVPALARQLEKIDDAVKAGDYARARGAVRRLVAQVVQAQVDGQLSDEQAQRIVAAARSVLQNLPGDEDDTDEADEGTEETA